MDDAKQLAADLESAAEGAEQTAAKKREVLGAKQLEIQGIVATHAEKLDAKRIESLEELPEEMQGMIKNRGLKRLQHSRELRAAQTELIKVAVASSQCVLQAGSPSASASGPSRVPGSQSLSIPSQPISAAPGSTAGSASSQSPSHARTPSASASGLSLVVPSQSLFKPSH